MQSAFAMNVEDMELFWTIPGVRDVVCWTGECYVAALEAAERKSKSFL